MTGPYINDPGFEVPENTIYVIPNNPEIDGFYKDIVQPLKGETKRDWFNAHFYYCLPLTIGNQYGFLIKSARNFDAVWDGSERDPYIVFTDDVGKEKQVIKGGFGNGIITIQNHFMFKTPIGINLMTIQPPNMFINGCVAMTGVIETDQIRRDFTFNLKLTVPHYKVSVKVGDPLGAFIPIPRYFVDNFNVTLFDDKELIDRELAEQRALSSERQTIDKSKNHQSGRRYFKGSHSDGSSYPDHQRTLK
jgi:hypothetical protein